MNAFQKRKSLYVSCPSSKRTKVILCRGNAGSILQRRCSTFSPSSIGFHECWVATKADGIWLRIWACSKFISVVFPQPGVPRTYGKNCLVTGEGVYQYKTRTWTSFSLSNISYNWCTVLHRGLQKAKETRVVIQRRWIKSDPLTVNMWNRFVGWWNWHAYY